MQSLVIAFAMYSKIPMPVVEWNEKNMKYAFCFFPLIGLVIGMLQIIAFRLLAMAGAGSLMTGAALTVIPLLVTGGIHLDGFMDTSDALSSYGDREKKLEILKDSHIGAFAVIRVGIYLILTLGLYSEIGENGMMIMALGYAFERALSGLAAINFKGAREQGMLATFEKRAAKKNAMVILVIWAVICAVAMAGIGGISGAAAGTAAGLNAVTGLLAVAGGLATMAYYHHVCMQQFGGTTGDLAGWFLQNCELVMLMIIVVCGWLI